MAAQNATKSAMFFMGSHYGFNSFDPLKEFTASPIPSISNVIPSACYSIYTDDNYTNLWVTGRNYHGECCIDTKDSKRITTFTPITYFKDNHISIKKICLSIVGNTTFFIDDDNRLYACGQFTGNGTDSDKKIL